MNKKWITRNGKSLEVKDMDTEHIKTILFGLMTGKKFGVVSGALEFDNDNHIVDNRDYWFEVFKRELKRREVE